MKATERFFGKKTDVRTLVVCPYPRDEKRKHRFDEFVSLCEAAAFEVVGVLTAPVRDIQPGTYFRGGHVEQIAAQVAALGAHLVAVDAELSPAQQKNLDKAVKAGVLDRSAIILTIFGRRAHTRAGKLQVELAQYNYVLPRLVGLWSHFDRERGGIGVRGGAGEKQIEVDRRLIRRAMTQIRRDLKTVERTRDLHRAQRRAGELLHVAVVGYTNVGKSTLVRALTRDDVLVQDLPFATLDPLTRRVQLSDGLAFLLTDTVGFVQDLPHGLVAAFKSTLEETLEADVLVHVIDVAAPEPEVQVRTTDAVLEELGAGGRPTLYVLNKIDQLREPMLLDRLVDLQPQVRASLATGVGLDAILDWVRSHARRRSRMVRIRIPIDRADVIRRIEAQRLGAGVWSETAVEYEVPAHSEWARDWAAG